MVLPPDLPIKDHILDKSALNPFGKQSGHAAGPPPAPDLRGLSYEKDRTATDSGIDADRLHGQHGRRKLFEKRRAVRQLPQCAHENNKRSANALRSAGRASLHLSIDNHRAQRARMVKSGGQVRARGEPPKAVLTGQQLFAMLLPLHVHLMDIQPQYILKTEQAPVPPLRLGRITQLPLSKDIEHEEDRTFTYCRRNPVRMSGQRGRVRRTSGHIVQQLFGQPAHADHEWPANALRPTGRVALHLQVSRSKSGHSGPTTGLLHPALPTQDRVICVQRSCQ